MPVKIRLMRVGAKKRPFYRIVAVDERKKRTGGYLEFLGTYNPLTNPKEIILKQDLIDTWVKKGAVLSDGYLRIIGQAPQKPPRKPKKEKAEAAPAAQPAAAQAVSETPAEENTEAPAQEASSQEQAPETPTEETTPAEVTETTEETPETPTEEEQTESPEAGE